MNPQLLSLSTLNHDQAGEQSTTFLHVADVHLGYDKYDNPERSKDFFMAFRDLLLRYAVQDPVDFVLIAGDLFEYRSILPNVLNQAELALGILKEAGIPVVAIEGNHDNRPYGVKTTWLRYLSDHDFLMLLEPEEGQQGIQLQPWDPHKRKGGYIDLSCGVRVVGSQWYGSAAPRSIEDLAAAIGALPKSDLATILMFHHGLEGQIARYQGALRYADVLPLRDVGVDYLALGHIHKHYSMENWIFNPGSVEANSIEESQFERGGLRVKMRRVEGSLHISPKLIQDYYQRPCYRLKVETTDKQTSDQVRQTILDTVDKLAETWDPVMAPIVEVKVQGSLGFERAELKARELRQTIQDRLGALLVLLKIEAVSMEIIDPDPDPDKLAVEEHVYQDILLTKASYRQRHEELAKVLIQLKEMSLDDRPVEQMYQHVDQGYLGIAEEDI